MAEKIKFYGTLKIDFEGETVDPGAAVSYACHLMGMKYVGSKVSKKERIHRKVVKFHDTYFYVKDCFAKETSKIVLVSFSYVPEEYEGVVTEGYKYYVPNCDTNRDETYCFKEHEKKMAEDMAALWSSQLCTFQET